MKIEKDLKRIEALGLKNEKDNWDFRAFLKWNDKISEEELDNIVHELNNKISSQIDCCSCANCCKIVTPILSNKDISRLAKHLNLSNTEFREKYTEKDEDGDTVFNSKHCPFLNDNKCTIYEQRPDDCRSFPHLHKKGFRRRLIGVIDNASLCPIVYNVYEELKDRLWEDDPFDDDTNEDFF